MSNENPKYEYKFLTDDSYTVRKNIPLYMAVDQAQKCLASEGVVITPASFVKCIDIYMRIIGICRSVNEDEFPPICILSGIISFKDNREKLDNPKCLEMYQKLFDLINECIDDEHKMPASDLEQIKANMSIVMKEVCIFCNDIVNLLVEEYTEKNTLSVTALVYTRVPDYETDHRLSIELSHIHEYGTHALLIQSSVLVPMTENTATGILLDSFPKEAQERIRKAEQDKAKEEEKVDESSDQQA